jgi:2-methylcitrate dehydratase PrpD
MAAGLTRDLGKFISALRYEDIPQDALPFIHTGFTDCVGVMLAGAKEEAPQYLRKVLAPQGGESNLLFGEGRAGAPDAAWINGTAAHALDYDDVALRGHPSTVLVPAILAEAQAVGATGKEMMVAYAAGYETWAELARRDPDQHQGKGWHPTGIFGAIGAAAACAKLRKLDADKAAVAIAIGASQAGGLISNFGTMTKPFHAGRAAHAGIISARLADAGFTASPDALEHKPGFLDAVSPGGRADNESPVEAGVDWKLPRDRLSVKKYPMCFATHAVLDGMFDMLGANKVAPEDVSRVDVSIRRRHTIVLRNHAPQTGLEAKFSMEFAMASALIAGRVSLNELTDGFVLRADMQEMMKRVSVTGDDREADPPPPKPIYDHVAIQTRDGRKLESGPIAKVRGGPDSPLTSQELWAKFESCAEAGEASVPARSLFDSLMSLERVGNVREIPGLAT